ncbi:MAG TPA: pilus assembly protein TadG-related protein [Pirellulaceae bacterium]|nr:pilus assembly protein TadG-related protein [Pirellulaceae bacterium]
MPRRSARPVRVESHPQQRRGSMLIFAVLLMVLVIAIAAFAIDLGGMMLTRTNLQSAADSAALAGASRLGLTDVQVRLEARNYANMHSSLEGNAVELADADIEIGFWNRTLKTFQVQQGGNAVRVKTRAPSQGFFVAGAFGAETYDSEATAIAAAVPRDIVFVVDLSGSMDDNTEPAWATDAINSAFGGVGSQLLNETMTDLFGTTDRNDRDLREFLESQGFPIASREFTYAVLTMDQGFLAQHSNTNYRINPSSSESARKQRAYAWLREEFLPPAFASGNPRIPFTNQQFWDAYIDYILYPVNHNIGPPNPPPARPAEPQPPQLNYSHCYRSTHPPTHHTVPTHSGPSHSGQGNGNPSHSSPGNGGPSHSGPSHSSPGNGGPSHSSPSHSTPSSPPSSPPTPLPNGPVGQTRPGGVMAIPVSTAAVTVALETGYQDPACVAAENQRYANAMATYQQQHLHWQTVLIPQWEVALQNYYDVYLPQYLQMAASKGSPRYRRGTLPPGQTRNEYALFDRIGDLGLSSFPFNNPNRDLNTTATNEDLRAHANRFGFETLTQFMVDHGSNLRPRDAGQRMPLARSSPDYVGDHTEMVGDSEVGYESFRLPPRTYPMHAVRRSLIRALKVVEQRNEHVEMSVRDFVGIVSFDRYDPPNAVPQLLCSLTGDYEVAKQACTGLEAVGDKYPTTATEPGVITARNHLDTVGRPFSDKVIVLFTDGVPNQLQSTTGAVQSYVSQVRSSDATLGALFYNSDTRFTGDRHWRNAVLMQVHQVHELGWDVFAVGIGAGADAEFMRRIAVMGGTDDLGADLLAGGDPRTYEDSLSEIFKKIVHTPRIVLVK